MNRALRDKIREEADNRCILCRHDCGKNGSPHHVIKISEEPLLRDCKKNIMWVCLDCHRKTENDGKFQARLQRKLQDKYFEVFNKSKNYTVKEIAQMVQAPVKDIEKAMQKGLLKWEFIDGVPKAKGISIIKFLMGGKLRNTEELNKEVV